MYDMTVSFFALQEARLVWPEITLAEFSMTNRLVYNNLVDHEE